MSDFINKLRELNVSEDSFLTLSYTEGNDVWHINDGYVNDSVYETETAGYLGNLLASNILLIFQCILSTVIQVKEMIF
jgi:hypothetical protein